MTVWRSRGRLADGREIVYFDETAASGRAAVADTRDLPPVVLGSSALRFDPLAGEWVMYAAQRQERTYRPVTEDCPLCPSRPGRPTEVPADSYDVVVFGNRFPALNGPGRCEVICFTQDHEASFAGLGPERVRTVFEAWADRTSELGSLPDVRHVYCFENRGEEIGVTLHHPHGQVYAFPFVPPRTRRLITRAREHRAETGRNLFDDVVAAEVADGRRILASNEHWTAFVPQSARWPFEIMIFPAVRVPDLAAVGEPARDAFGPLCTDVLRRLDGLFGVPMPYIAAWQQAPTGPEVGDDVGGDGGVGGVGGFGKAEGAGDAEGARNAGGADLAELASERAEFGLHLHVTGIRRALGKLKYLAGTESGAGAWSNDVLPEDAARMLAEVSDGAG